jgi:hypothetical protein
LNELGNVIIRAKLINGIFRNHYIILTMVLIMNTLLIFYLFWEESKGTFKPDKKKECQNVRDILTLDKIFFNTVIFLLSGQSGNP